MEMNSPNKGSESGFFKAKIMETVKKTKKIGEDDPRKIFHCIKVGLALTFVSLFYYFRPLYDGFGQAGIWAVFTVVVVFEFTVGGTLSKSLNRGCATLVAGALGLGAEYLASLCGEKWKPVVLGLLVFILAAASTFMRFFPNVKKRYDYGMLIFILTFSLVAVSGSRVTDILQIAHQRMTTILIGGATCMIISIFICPVWAGLDLHNLVAGNIEKLAAFLEGFGGEICRPSGDESSMVTSKNDQDKSYLQSHKSVLNSKAAEESLANFAWWEPGHGRFKFHHPWNQYLRIGVLARECAYQIEALSVCINSKPEITSEFQLKIQSTCEKISTELGKALKEIASAMKNMTFPLSTAGIHIQNSKATANEITRILEKSSLTTKVDLHEIMPILVIASVLIDIVKCVEKISIYVDELCRKAHFREPESTTTASDKLLHRGILMPVIDRVVIENSTEKNKLNNEIDDIANNDDHVVVEISRTLGNSSENYKNPHLFEKQ